MNARRALIIGGSIGGLFAALMLRRHGWDAQVFERVASPLASRGAGIVTHPELRRILEQLGLDPHCDFGIEVQTRLTLARDGRAVGTHHCPQVMTSWDRLFRMLRQALPDGCYAQGAEFCGMEQAAGGVRAHFADGRHAEGALLIGADGRCVRAFGRRSWARCRRVTQGMWRGGDCWPRPQCRRQPGARCSTNSRSACRRVSRCWVIRWRGENNDLRPGHRRYNFVWYRPADEAAALPDLLTDAAGQTHALSIPPPLIRPDVLGAMRSAAEANLAPVFARIVAATPQPFLQPIYDLESPRLAFPHSVLLGDAAFVARPHVGAGVTKAAEDAACLAAALATEPDLGTALQRYEAARLPAGQRIVRRGRHLGAYLQAQISTEEQREAATRHHTADAVMAETALLDF